MEHRDLYFLLFLQVPNLGDLCLYGTQLLTGKWNGAVELFRIHDPDWYNICLGGGFMHETNLLWPISESTPGNEEEEYALLEAQEDYILFGGRHPSLPNDTPDDYSMDFLNETSYDCQGDIDIMEQRMVDWR